MRLLLFLTLFNFLVNKTLASDPTANTTIEEIIRSHGFDVELHQVTTLDGYILTLHRLVNIKENHGLPEGSYYHYEVDKKPVIVQHGLFGSSIDWLISSPFLYSNTSKSGDNFGFGLHMTDRYDVWLSNARGNFYSRKHRQYTVEHEFFWRFSFDHMAEYDLPAVIDYVRNVTSHKTVGYVAFSQGTAAMFALLSMRPEYAEIVKPFVALAPITTVADVMSPIPTFNIKSLAYFGSFLVRTPSEFKVPEWLSGLFWKSTNLNATRVPVYSLFIPSISTWELLHWAELIITERFARFDYGSESENEAVYGQPQPPDFPLSNIPPTATIALFRSQNDDMSSVPDQERLIAVLKQNGVQLIDHMIPDPSWAHTDFLHGVNAGMLIYDKVIDVLDKFT